MDCHHIKLNGDCPVCLKARVEKLETIHNNTRAELAKWQSQIPEQAFNDMANALNP